MMCAWFMWDKMSSVPSLRSVCDSPFKKKKAEVEESAFIVKDLTSGKCKTAECDLRQHNPCRN